MKVVLLGATGMVGAGALLECVDDPRGVFAPLLQRLLPNRVTNTVAVGRALIRVSAEGYAQEILESQDINRAAAGV